ncbi:hypothetical protein [Pokkaliibacter plantistimulans]|uniref:hypothetical protein n=1 Tax=Pokkaliibacter plantistimulans TaxID=1635171 RepID=UPI000D74042D|nr:hypothetical protein [Pokkaliibacter plantistimulans]
MSEGLTVFLGGAGMNGDYQKDMVRSLRTVGIANPVYGNYSGWFKGFDQQLPDKVDTFGDSSAVIFYNQDENDPIALQLVNTNNCKVEGSRSLFGLVVNTYSGINSQGKPCEKYVIRYELSTPRPKDFSLQNLEIFRALPRGGQFNFIGYSWGSVIAARSALFYARRGVTVDHLVLIGAPINQSLLVAVRANTRIKKVSVINLTGYGDRIYAGMSDVEIIQSVPTMAEQMKAGDGRGHFYYAVEDGDGPMRRLMLAKTLYREGLR